MTTWFKYDDDYDEEPMYEAELVEDESGVTVSWWHVNVGYVLEEWFLLRPQAEKWLTDNYFEHYA